MSQLTIRLLGPPQIELDGQPIEVDTRKAIALLAYLADTLQLQSRNRLTALFWPDSNESRARTALRRTLSALNKAIGKRWIAADRSTLALYAQEDLWVDVHRMQELLSACPPEKVETQFADFLPRLKEAAALFRGDFLEGFTLTDSSEFDEWQTFRSQQYRQDRQTTLSLLARCHALQGEWQEAINAGRQRLALDVLHEPAHQQLMRLYALAGQRTAAVRQYEECVRLLDEELGVAPQPNTTALLESIVDGTLESQRVMPTTLSVRHAKGHLPRQVTSFVGRERELETIYGYLDASSGRLVTILGPGGTGKTRLAIEAASNRLDRFKHGVYFVPLAPASRPEYLISTLADTLQFAFYGGGDEQAQKTQLLDYLREKEMLLVLDNFEHLLEATELIAEILQEAPGVKLLVTSQERLNLMGECLVELYGLQCPSNGVADITSSSAVSLFVDRAHQVNTHFSLTEEEGPHVARICRLVGGLPLGIELAATWVRMLSCREIAGQIEEDLDFLATNLQNVPQRHRSLRAVFEHSWRLLSPEERGLLRKLLIFRDGFELAAAKQVASATLPLLLALADKSMLQRRAGGRFEVLEVLHQYALEKFADGLDATLQSRHARYYADFVEERRPALTGRDQAEALAAISAEIENVRQAWRWALSENEFSVLERLLEGLFRFYQTRSWFREGADAFAELASIAHQAKNELLLGQALSRQGRLLVRMTLLDEGQAVLMQALDVLQDVDESHELAPVKSVLGVVAEMKGNYDASRQWQLESQAIYQHLGDRRGEAGVLLRLGNLAYAQGQFSEARDHYLTSRTLFEQLGDRRGVAVCLNNLGTVAETLSQYNEARDLYRQSVDIKRAIGDRSGVAYSLNNLGHVNRLIAEYDEAAIILGESLAIFREVGDRKGIAYALINHGNIAYDRRQFNEAYNFYEDALVKTQEIGYRPGIAYARNHLGNTEREQGRYEVARAHYRAALEAALEGKVMPSVMGILVEYAACRLAEGELAEAARLLHIVLEQPGLRARTAERGRELLASTGEGAESIESGAPAPDSTLEELIAEIRESGAQI